MSGSPAFAFLAGAVTMGYLVAALFFLRFWARSRDALFLAFAGAFALLALNQALVVLSAAPREEQGWIYVIRLAGYLLIIAAIVRKNLRGAR
jgi:hypothetical protein